MTKKLSFINYIRIWGILLALGFASGFVCLDLIKSYNDMTLKVDETGSAYLDRQKQVIRREVMRVADMIRDQKAQIEELTKAEIKSRVYEAHAIARHMYLTFRDQKTAPEIQQMVIEALRTVRFADGHGYYFATRLTGEEVLFADRPELEGRNLLQMQDLRGRFVIRDLISIARQKGEGFYEYHWTKPFVQGSDFKKISFIKRLKL